MEIKWIDNVNPLPTEEPLIAAVSMDESHAVAGLLDDGFEHNVLLRKVLKTDENLDKYYRIILDADGADWTFVVPSDYKNISNKERRIKEFYNEGYKAIIHFLQEIGYPENVEIPKRYRRHLDYLTNEDYSE
ncbi:MAG: hypothetical protein ACI4L2_04890 [Wujia sp.]